MDPEDPAQPVSPSQKSSMPRSRGGPDPQVPSPPAAALWGRLGAASGLSPARACFYILLFALMAIPYGLSNAIIVVIIPYRMRAAGYSVETIGVLFSILMAPTYLQFLYAPLADWRFSKKTWLVLSALASAVCFALPEYWASSNHYSPLVLLVILLGQVASGLYLCSIAALNSALLSGRDRDHAASFRVAGTVLGNLLGTVLALRPEGPGSAATNALLFALLSLLPGLAVLLIRAPARRPAETASSLGSELGLLRRDPRFWITLLLSVSPSCAAGLMGLFSALAVDFHATPGHVVLANGTLGSLAMVLGSTLGGSIGAWGDRRTVYVACSASLSMIATAMVFLPQISCVYLGGVLLYNFVCGLSYSIFDMMIFVLIQKDSKYAATKYGFFMSLANLPVAYVTYIDSRFHHQFGARSVFLIDALLNIAGIAMWALMWRQLTAQKREPVAASSD
jgi:MFS family permease